MPLRRLLISLLLWLPLIGAAQAPAATDPAHRRALPATEDTLRVAPRPFDARYRLEIKGWPRAYIDHRLSREGHTWESRMETGIRIGRGSERSRFLLREGRVRSLYYASGYSLLGVGDSYRLDAETLAAHPDRQTALFALSRRVIDGDCAAAPCPITYLDHKGREEALEARALGEHAVTLPAGTFEAIRVEAMETDKPDRRLVFHFHPQLPGLLLSADYHRGGEHRSQLALSELNVRE